MIPESAVTVSRDNQRSRWIKLRTTILLRWVAILGQIGRAHVRTPVTA